MKNGKADVALLQSGYDIDEIEGRDKLKIVSGVSSLVHFIAFNVREAIKWGGKANQLKGEG